MKCPRLGTRLFRTGCRHWPRPGGRPAGYLYRDRRRRARWRRRWRRLGALAGAALLIALIARIPRVPRPTVPTARPSPSPTPTATAAPTPSPTPGLPIATPAPEQLSQPSLNIDSRAALIDLYWWMIHSGTATAQLDALTIPESELYAVTDRFSNYFDSFSYSAESPRLRVEFKPGVRVLQALGTGETERLDRRDNAIAARAVEIVRTLIRDGMTDLQRELALHDYIAAHCAYLAENMGEDTASARGFFENGRCQCAGYVDTFRLLARLAGLEVEMIGGPTTRDAPGDKGHAWNLIRLDGLWYVVDVTWDDMSGEGGAPEYPYFNLPPAAFGDSRSWDQDCCPGGEYARVVDETYYYNRPAYIARSLDDALRLAAEQLDAGGTAWLCFPGDDFAQAVCDGLAAHYPSRIVCADLGGDLRFGLCRLSLDSP